ncbi:MAG TPA: enoyl-CoA hydratase-related protein [Polyangia bacterium]
MSESAAGPVTLTRQGRVAVVTLTRPDAANALSLALVAGLRAAFAEITRTDPAASAVVVTGAGDKAFCAGADLKERLSFTLETTRDFLDQLGGLLDSIAAFPRPVIAALNGVALGGGLELALACDLRLAATGVTLGLPEVRLGIIPGAGGTQRLARLVGPAIAKELILTGRRIDADKARELGIVNAVVARESLLETAVALGNEIGESAPIAVTEAKRAIDDGLTLSMAQGLAVERAAYEVCLMSEDRNEGLRSFADKRKPVWRGK